MKSSILIRRSVYSALVFGTLLMLSAGYAAYSLATETANAPLTATKWNAVIDAINDADSRISGISASISSLQASAGGIWSIGANSSINYGSGKVGIGTSTPNSSLHIYNTTSNAEVDIQSVAGANKHWGIYQNSGDESLRFWNNAAGGDSVTVTNGGKVGIGTSIPWSKLEVVGAASIDTIGVAGKWTARFRDSSASATGVGAGILLQGNKSVAGAVGNFAAIAGLKENATDGNEQGYLSLLTTPSSGDITERMRIDSAGNVGIGTATPKTKLDVNGAISSAGGKEVRNIFTWADPLGTSRTTPLHIKTNWPTTNNAMYRFTIEWYLFANSLPIYSECVGYLYSGTNTVYNGSCKDIDTGVILTQYKSSDGYLVLKLTPNTSWYYAGFGVSLQQFNLGWIKPLPTFTTYEQTSNL